LDLNPNAVAFHSSDTDHDRKTAPRPKCLFQEGYYRNKGHNTEKSALGLSSVEENSFPVYLRPLK
jgi:hypothetical protein